MTIISNNDHQTTPSLGASIKIPYGTCVAVLVILLGILAMCGTNRVSSRYWANQRAMTTDPALPFAAWDRAIAQAPSQAQKNALTDAKRSVVYVFEKPFWALCTASSCSPLTEVHNLWTFGHQPPATLYQTLGGDVAYRQALATVRQNARNESDKQDEIVKAIDAIDAMEPTNP